MDANKTINDLEEQLVLAQDQVIYYITLTTLKTAIEGN